jgi:hypothetical protein
MTNAPVTIDLQPFCSTDATRRPTICQPFSCGDWTYATNGHIMVRVPRRPDVGEVKNAPMAEKLFDQCGPTADMRPLPQFEFPEPDPSEPCATCDGRGTVHDCPDCSCGCEQCGGRGLHTKMVTGAIGKRPFNAKYLKMIAQLPAATVPATQSAGDGPMPFAFGGGGEGLLMPVKTAGHKHVSDPERQP